MAIKASNTGQVTYAPGEVLFEQGAAADQLFVINGGFVELTRTAFRESLVVETIGPGHLCGEVAVAAGAAYGVTARAVDEVSALVVQRDQIDAVLLSKPELAARIARKLATRLTQAQFRIGNLALRSAEARVMLQLLAEAERSGATAGEAFATIPFDLPDVLALERKAVDGALRTLIGASLIEIDGHGRFRILDAIAFERRLRFLELRDRFED